MIAETLELFDWTPPEAPELRIFEAPVPKVRILRPYQQKALEDSISGLLEKRSGMLVMATGGGKTVVFSKVAEFWILNQKQKVLILTDQFDLVDQAIRNLRLSTGIMADAEQGERSASRNASVVVATVQTMASRLDTWEPDHFGLVICDECDRAVAPTWAKTIEHFCGTGNAALLGVTATPRRSDKKDILKTFKNKFCEIGALELMDQGWLSSIQVQTVPLKLDLSEAEDQERPEKDFDADRLGNCIRGAFREICQAIHEYAADRKKIIVFCPDVKTSAEFADVANSAGIPAEHIHGGSRNRRELQQGFRDGRFRLLSNPCLLGRGYDEPAIDCVINLRFTKSIAFYQQICGRATRLFCPHGCDGPCQHEDRKRDALILDFLCQFKTMGPVRPSALIAESEAVAQAMQKVQESAQGRLDIREIREAAKRDIRASLMRQLHEAQSASGSQGQYFNAFHWAAQLRLEGLMDYEPETEAESAPVRKGLMTKLRKAGFIEGSITCQGHAEKIMARVLARREAGLATFKQIFFLQKNGVQNPENMTVDQASAALDRIFSRK